MDRLLLKNAGELITCVRDKDFQIIKNGGVLIEDGLITSIGKSDELLKLTDKFDQLEIIDAEGKPVLPGFIDPHTHFIFGGYREDEFNWRLQGVPYLEIMKRGGGIINTVKATRNASREELKKSGKKRLELMLSYGVTTVEGKSGYGLELDTELKQLDVMEELDREHPVDIVKSFLGAHAVPEEYKDNKAGYLDYVLNDMIPVVAESGKAEFCDVFCDIGVFTVEEARQILIRGQELGLKGKIHADEIERTGGANLAVELAIVSADHLLKISDEDIHKMAKANVVPVLLPITAFSLKEEYAPARKIVDAGLNLALATDLNPGSAFSGSIPLLISLSTLYMGLSLEEVIMGLTINAAAALNREDRIGSIEPGKQADLIILDAPSYKHLSYHIGVNLVEKVIKEGRLVYKKSEIWSNHTRW
jgi:imidazolonepropionase